MDTHVWVWWVQGDPSMPQAMREQLEMNESGGFGVSIISADGPIRNYPHVKVIP